MSRDNAISDTQPMTTPAPMKAQAAGNESVMGSIAPPYFLNQISHRSRYMHSVSPTTHPDLSIATLP
jgi:hypothetical protein